MANSKATKKALFMSMLSLLLCFTMLMGATFAWFTDTVTSSNNKIIAGNLDVQLLMDTGSGYQDISDNTSPIFGTGSIAADNNAETLWEPGKTQVAYLAIKNNGSLALKYTVSLKVEDIAKSLYKAMRYEIIPDKQYGEVTAWNNNGSEVIVGEQSVSDVVALGVGDTHYFALAIHMQEDAGNEYQNGEVDFDLTVLATQQSYESDSFDDTYDQFAEWPEDNQPQTPSFTVYSAAALQAAMTPTVSNDELIVNIAEDIEFEAGETWTPLNLEAYSGNARNIIINGNGHTIKGLDAPLIGKAFFGNTSVEINDLTLTSSNINSSEDYVGAFTAYVDNCASVKLSNCHLLSSSVTGAKDAAGLVGFCSSPLTMEKCSVIGCEITGAGSVGALVAMLSLGQGSEVAAIKEITVTGNTLVSTKNGDYRIGELIGTTNMPTVNLSDITASGNNCTQADSTGVMAGYTATEWIGRNTGASTVTGDTSAQIN